MTIFKIKENIVVAFLLIASSAMAQYSSSKIEVRFDLNKTELLPKTIKTLDSLLVVFKNYSDYSIELNGHCDHLGTSELNSPLSLNRAWRIATYFKSKGIDSKIISAYGYGNDKPKYDMTLDSLNRRVEIIVSINKLQAKNQNKPTDEKKEPISLDQKIKDTNVGGKFIVNAIEFYPGLSQPLPSAIESMNELKAALMAQPKVNIEIQGHICCSDADEENLSGKRAKVVYDYLIDNGIDSTRLAHKGFGHKHPLNNESTPQLAQLNRRVEIMITRK